MINRIFRESRFVCVLVGVLLNGWVGVGLGVVCAIAYVRTNQKPLPAIRVGRLPELLEKVLHGFGAISTSLLCLSVWALFHFLTAWAGNRFNLPWLAGGVDSYNAFNMATCIAVCLISWQRSLAEFVPAP